MLCQTCTKKAVCSGLCPEAEVYVSQDEVKQREATLPGLQFGRWPQIRKPRKGLNAVQKKIMHLIVEGKGYRQIAEILKISEKTASREVHRISKKFAVS